MDKLILRIICERFNGGPVGLGNIAVSVGEEQDTIEDVYEPYLIQEGYLARTSRGREATPKAFEILGIERNRPAASRTMFTQGSLNL